jgi:glycosyltransferase involved in cell wall biosynthesis
MPPNGAQHSAPDAAPLHVAIDARRLRDFGIGTYIRNFTRALARIDSENQYTLVTLPEDAAALEGLGHNFRVAIYPFDDRSLRNNLQIPAFFKSLNTSLCHIPLNSVAWMMPKPYVVTIHDMSTLLFPQRENVRRTLHEARYRRGALRASRIIAVSQATRRDIESVLHVPPSRVSTVYSAPDLAFTATAADPAADRQVLERYSISFPFILYAGTIRVHKNIPRLVEAFAVLRNELGQHPVYRDLRLVIIGDELSKNPAVRRAVASTRMAAAVRFLGFVPLDTLCVFYRAAAVFAFPSLYEGFGLAPLEAMACGTPVVASNIASLMEAVGDAAVLIHPENVFDIARGIREVLLDDALRQRLFLAGRGQAERFHWDHTAREILDIYRDISINSKH